METADLKKARRKKLSVDPMKLDRQPPHSIEAEQGLLGAILLSPNDNMNECVEKLGTDAEIFYDLRHQSIYEVLVEMWENKKPIDLITLQQALKDKQMLQPVGGFAYLATLPDKAGTAGHIGPYAQIIEEKFTLRKMLRTCSDIVGRIYEHEGEIDQLLDEAEINILAVRGKKTETQSSRTLVNEAITRLEVMLEKRGEIGGLSTGLSELDHVTDGLHGGEMIVVSGYPGTGKTALALNIAVFNALQKIPVAIYSAEMSPVALMVRSLCAESAVDRYAFRNGSITDADFPRLTGVAGKLANAPLYIINAAGWSIGQVQASARRLAQQYGIKLFVVDYLQLLTAKGETREQTVAKISAGVKTLAMELGIPGIALSQLNDDGRLRDSRAIGQDADGIWRLKNDGDTEPYEQKVNLEIKKHREGAIGDVPLLFRKRYTRFECAPKIDPSDVPHRNPHKD